MKNEMYHTVFRTKWGWFGLAGNKKGLTSSCLPMRDKQAVKDAVGRGTENPAFFSATRDLITSYYEGSYVEFGQVKVNLDGLTGFQKKVLSILQNVSYGEKRSYTDLARMAGKPTAVRAIGGVMARNPVPLIIPCHRVVRTDGSLGGFSGQGGIETKKKMLDLEFSNK